MNSKALQGLAAIAFVVGVLVTVPPYLNNLFAEDILVRVNRDEPTLPRELAQRLQEIPWEMDEFVYKFEPGFWNAVEPVYQLETENRDVIDSALKSALASIKNEIDNLARGLRIKTVDYASLGKLTIEVVNNSNMMIPSVQIRINNIHSLWGVQIDGTFLGDAEANLIVDQAMKNHSNSSLLFPELTVLHPESVVRFEIFGSTKWAELQMSAPGYTYSIEELIKVKNAGLIRVLQDPHRYVAIMIMLLGLTPALFVFLSSVFRRHVINDSRKYVMYDAAGALAREGDAEGAMVLLRVAVKHGYTNHEHIARNADFHVLSGREDFKLLLQGVQEHGTSSGNFGDGRA